jgi:hypothetical protein
MRLNPTFLAIPFILLLSCEKATDDKKYTGESTEEILLKLENAYTQESESDLKNILDEWSSVVNAKSISSLSNDTEEAIYKIFIEFYNPFNIDRYGIHEWGNDMYAGFNYVIIQNEVHYLKESDVPDYSNYDSIVDFRPEIDLEGKSTLYLVPDYHEAILYFLNPSYNPLENTPIFEEVSEESWNRYEYLRQQLAIIPGHWGNYWHLETHPYIDYLTIDNALQKATVHFRIGYMFGEAEFQKSLLGWDMTSSDITAIE